MDRVRAVIDRLAGMLHAHIDTVREIENASLAAMAGAGRDRVIEVLDNLRSLRARIIEDLDLLASEELEDDNLEDAWALAGYYLEAASKREEKALQRTSKLVDVSSDLEEIENAKNLARAILDKKKI